MNTPFQWGKQVASHFGGTRNPLVVSWPARIKDKGTLRTQFHHVIDVVPTLLEAAGVPEPVEVNGVWQKPIEGVSMVYSFDDPKAKGHRGTQYFEMFGNRALYHDGWIAVCRHGRLPWMNQGSYDFADDKWELYNIDDDFSEAHDLAAKNPEKLRELQDMFWAEAAKYDVLPLDDRFAERGDPSLRPSLIEGRTHFTYFAGAERIPESSSPNIKNKSHIITAYVDQPGDGVLVAAGGTVGGYTLFVKDGKPTYEYNWFGQQRYRVTSSEPLPAGKSTVRVEFKYDGGGLVEGRHGHDVPQRQEGRGRPGGTDDLRPLLGRRDFRHRPRHRLAGQRPIRLAVQVHRGDQQGRGRHRADQIRGARATTDQGGAESSRGHAGVAMSRRGIGYLTPRSLGTEWPRRVSRPTPVPDPAFGRAGAILNLYICDPPDRGRRAGVSTPPTLSGDGPSSPAARIRTRRRADCAAVHVGDLHAFPGHGIDVEAVDRGA